MDKNWPIVITSHAVATVLGMIFMILLLGLPKPEISSFENVRMTNNSEQGLFVYEMDGPDGIARMELIFGGPSGLVAESEKSFSSISVRSLESNAMVSFHIQDDNALWLFITSSYGTDAESKSSSMMDLDFDGDFEILRSTPRDGNVLEEPERYIPKDNSHGVRVIDIIECLSAAS